MKTDSTLAIAYPAHSNNYGWNDLTGAHHTGGRCGNQIKKITIHHMAGKLSAKQCGAIFQNPSRCGSSHYGVGYDGSIGQYVNESEIAWTDGNWESNCTSITIETSDDTNKAPYSVNDKTYDALIRLVADVSKRNNIKLEVGKTLTWHSMYQATDCPSDFLRARMQDICDKANAINTPLKKNQHIINGYDCHRKANYMVVYTKGKRTGTNKYGREFRMDNKGTIVSSFEYGDCNKELKGMWVVSGHGEASSWMAEHLREGSVISIKDNVLTLRKY